MKPVHRFMVVDDDRLNNLVCKHIILRFDMEAQITLFTDPEKALGFIKDTFSDPVEEGNTVMFLDINMPVISGWEFLKVFETFEEKIRKQISIYILSSSIDQSDIEEAGKNPFVQGYYPKPLSLETINLINSKYG